jgi:hypothetical protein
MYYSLPVFAIESRQEGFHRCLLVGQLGNILTPLTASVPVAIRSGGIRTLHELPAGDRSFRRLVRFLGA